MNDWNREGIVVSLPAKEIGRVRFSASVFDHEDLLGASLSDELGRAIDLIQQAGAKPGSTVRYVVRPEMFTHGLSLSWLRETLGSIGDHVCVSDGSTIRVIPGMRNHVFFYAPGRRVDAEALGRLEQRAPELFSTVTAQINSAYRFGVPAKLYFPTPVALGARAEPEHRAPRFYRFYLSPPSIEDGVEIALQSEIHDIPGAPAEHLIYIPLTDSGADDASFVNTLAALLTRVFFDPSWLAILALPTLADRNDKLTERLGSVLAGLRNAKVLIPPIPASNIFFATEDVPADRLRALSDEMNFFAHDSYDFWRFPPQFYEMFQTIRVFARRGRHNPTALTHLLTALCGRKPELLWPRPSERRRA